MIHTIDDALPGLIEVILLFSLIDSCFERKFQIKYLPIIWCVCDFTIILATRSISRSLWITLTLSIMLETILIKILFESKIAKILFWLTFFNSIIGVCEISIYMITITILDINLQQILSIDIVNNTAAIISKLILWVIITRAKLINKKVEYKSGEYFIPLLIVPIVSIIAMLLVIDYSVQVGSDDRKTALVYLTVLGLFFMNIIVFYIYEHLHQMSKIKEEISLMEQQLVYQQKYFMQLEHSYQEVRGIKHDIVRHITLMNTLVKTKEYEKLEEYTKELSKSTDNMIKIVQTDNVILDAIMNEKYNTAKKFGIQTKFLVEKLDKNIINPTSICIIVSNILDNAIEGASNWKKEKIGDRAPLVEVKLYLQKNNLIFSVSNDAVKPQFKEGLILTSKLDKKNHGIGLKNVKKVIEEMQGYFEIGYTNNKFIFVCRIPVDD
ncbi:sensor histidine kinase [Anaeromicropila herbilytica]|uniref:Sensor histidine kinase n=1 Tax=Anaeromicropila herbilytica TaxID=2785025 RepID=A0A7R7IF39_9FIRM|nr:GHKL domain-containing protein [Anaeromicropila herbilytica]BCN32779.1 sensor histidine kinase [Anaeromicropila herbilytica]